MVHPLELVPDDGGEAPTVVIVPEVLSVAKGQETASDEATFAVPKPQKTGNGNGHGMPAVVGEGTGAALSYAKKVAPAVVKRLADICAGSGNHAAARAAARDLLQIAGLLAETHHVDILISFRALFQQMTVQELDGFMAKKEFPERLRSEAMKLLEHAA